METNLQRYPNAPRPDTIEAGDSFEDYVTDRLAESGITLRTYKSAKMQLGVGENRAGFEIKLDEGHQRYSHLSIEIAERRQASGIWVPSGIFRNDNSWLYIQGNRALFWVLFKPTLIERARRAGITPLFATAETIRAPIFEAHGTVRKFYLPPEEADALGKRFE